MARRALQHANERPLRGRIDLHHRAVLDGLRDVKIEPGNHREFGKRRALHHDRIDRVEHKLAGESYVGRVLVLDAAKGGVATAWMLHEMKARGVMPAALVLNAVNPIMVQGAALAGFTMISGFDVDITQTIPNGAMVEVDPTAQPPFIRLL